MDESIKPPRVFLSYARSDGESFAHKFDPGYGAVHGIGPAAIDSAVIKKEWRYARQQGVCVYPVQGFEHRLCCASSLDLV